MKIRQFTYMLLLLSLLGLAGSCHDYDTFPNTTVGNVDCLWTIIDEHYCFFDENDVDWEAVREKYRKEAMTAKTQYDLFDICSRMVNELQDGHVNLASPFNVSYYRDWWTAYPQNFNLRTLQQYYLDFKWNSIGSVMYKILPSGVAYIYYPSFAVSLGEGNWDYIFYQFKDCPGLIIDIRNNGGGDLSNVHTLVARFIDREMVGGYMRHKTGPGHSDFSEPYPVKYKPADDTHIRWNKPVAVLTNRSCYSAANDFVAVMKELPKVKIVGARTGGGGGMPFTYDLPLGWSIRMSVAPMTDSHGLSIEKGVSPSEGCGVSASDEQLASGHDPILDFAVSILTPDS